LNGIGVSWLRSRWFAWVQLIAGAIILYFMGRSLLHDWERMRGSGATFVFRPGWILLSLCTVWVMWVGLIEGWRRITVSWGQPLRWPLAGRIWMLSSFGKYIPGKVWAVAGMVALSERYGVNSKVTLSAAVLMQVLTLGAGLAVAALTLGPTVNDARPYAGNAMILLGMLVAVVLLAVSSRRVMSWLWRITRRHGEAPTPPGGDMLLYAIGINLATWMAYGLALLLLARGILPDVHLGWRETTGAFAFSYLLGYLGPMPSGLGMRELSLAWFLEPTIGVAPALALSFASRLAFTFNELGAGAPFFFTRGSTRDTT
jgi:hypothetical protein